MEEAGATLFFIQHLYFMLFPGDCNNDVRGIKKNKKKVKMKKKKKKEEQQCPEELLANELALNWCLGEKTHL